MSDQHLHAPGCVTCDTYFRDHTIKGLPDSSAHKTGWTVQKIDDIWCVGMEGNLQTRHDATLKITGGFLGDDEAQEVAQWIADRYNEARTGGPRHRVDVLTIAKVIDRLEKDCETIEYGLSKPFMISLLRILKDASGIPLSTPIREDAAIAADTIFPGNPSARHGFNEGVAWAIEQMPGRVRMREPQL